MGMVCGVSVFTDNWESGPNNTHDALSFPLSPGLSLNHP